MESEAQGEHADIVDTRQPTMVDVARLAQVSTAAVSYLLSGRDDLMRRVGADAQERIRHAVERLSYVQNKTARHLRLQRTERICVLLPRLGIPFADKMAQDIEAVAQRRGFATIVTTASNASGFRRILHEIESGLADGLIADLDGVMAGNIGDFREPLSRLTKNCLMIQGDGAIASPFSVLVHERIPALREALDHVVAAGHRHIVYICNYGSRNSPRVDTLESYVATHSGMMAPVVFENVDSRDKAVDRAHEIAEMNGRPTAVLVESDYTAVAMIEEFQRLGLVVPNDIAVVGCGNAEEGYFCNPRLSTLGPVKLSMTDATEHLLDVITGAAAPTRQFRVPWKLYVRESG